MKNVTLNEGITEIVPNTFGCCESLEYINIPKSVKRIRQRAFFLCNNLKNITFNEGLEEIAGEAFSSSYKLEHITLPTSIRSVGGRAFASSLKSVKLPKAFGEGKRRTENSAYQRFPSHVKLIEY